MQRASFIIRSGPLLKGRCRQRGQALIYGIFVMVGGLAALFFLFNTGQLTREKTKLVNTADAAAYSAGVMNARALNYEAYANRAMVANTVAIAQLVSLSSWVQYVDNLATFGYAAGNPFKYSAFYPSYIAATSFTGTIAPSDLETLSDASDTIIRDLLMNAQQVAYVGLIPARQQVMDDVAKANYNNDGLVTVEQLTLPSNDFTSFVSRYSDDERTRFAEVAKIAAFRDKFLPKRSWALPGLYSDCGGATATGRVDFLTRRGGTELLGFDEWKAMDTLSEKKWVPKNKTDVLCKALAENPAGWGAQTASDSPTVDLDPTHYDYSLPINPASSALAIATSSAAWGYSGMPNFYDLSESALSKEDPRLQFAIRVRRDKNQTLTSEGRSTFPNTPRLNAYKANPAGGSELVAVSASEVFFQRPADAGENIYGKEIGKPREIGSLFNPYWQVRLIHSPDGISQAQALQGAVLK